MTLSTLSSSPRPDFFLDDNGTPVAERPFNVILDATAPQDVHRRSILDLGDRAFLVESLLSKQECGAIVEAAERNGFSAVDAKKTSYRGCTKLAVDAPNFTASLWQRLKPHLPPIRFRADEDPHEINIHGIPFQLRGQWTASDLNPKIKVSKYLPGQHFGPHHDGHSFRDLDSRTFVTIVLYLNGDVDGGSTNFMSEDSIHHEDEDGRMCAREQDVLYRVHPETGRALIFNHHRLHEGELLRQGTKYILLAEVFYQREDDPESAMSPKERRAIELFREAESMELSGACEQAAECYRRAFKLCPALETCT